MAHHGKTGNPTGRPPYAPTEEARNDVKALASCGVTQDIIARYLHVAPMTLRLHFREELDFAAMKANQAVAINMFRIATRGNGSAAVTAGFKWLAIRAGWKETSALDVTMAGGGGLSGLLKRCLGEDAKPETEQEVETEFGQAEAEFGDDNA